MSKHCGNKTLLWAGMLLAATTLAVPVGQARERVKQLDEASTEQAKKLAEWQREQAKKRQEDNGEQGGGGTGGGGTGGGNTLQLPPEAASYAFKPGLNQELVREACLECHSADYVTSQPLQTKASWGATLDKMINVFKMDPLTTADRESILLYLTTYYGK